MDIFPELHREERGHAFYEGMELVPSPPTPGDKQTGVPVAYARFYDGETEWYVRNLDRDTWKAFGLIVSNGDMPTRQWDWFDLPGLESRVMPMVARDWEWIGTVFPKAVR